MISKIERGKHDIKITELSGTIFYLIPSPVGNYKTKCWVI